MTIQSALNHLKISAIFVFFRMSSQLAIDSISVNIYGFVSLVHHQEARSSKEVSFKKGSFICGETFRPRIKLRHTQFKALVQGYDFEMDDLGKIRFKSR